MHQTTETIVQNRQTMVGRVAYYQGDLALIVTYIRTGRKSSAPPST